MLIHFCRDAANQARISQADIELTTTDDMRTLARLRNIIDPLDLAIGESFAQVHGPLGR
jgi:hypothetical protein